MNDVIAISRGAADGDVRSVLRQVERARQVVGAGRDPDRRAGMKIGHGTLQLAHG